MRARPADLGDLQGGVAPLFPRAEQDVHLFERLVFMARQNR
jgi:hypothetical protein